MVCPQCKSDNVQRLNIIYQSGTQNIKTTSNTVGSGFGGGGHGIGGGIGSARTTTTGTSQSIMAQKAAPPAKKSFAATAILILAGLFVCFAMNNYLIGIILLGIGVYLGYKANSYNKTEWITKNEVWQKSWHCNKCGEIYAV